MICGLSSRSGGCIRARRLDDLGKIEAAGDSGNRRAGTACAAACHSAQDRAHYQRGGGSAWPERSKEAGEYRHHPADSCEPHCQLRAVRAQRQHARGIRPDLLWRRRQTRSPKASWAAPSRLRMDRRRHVPAPSTCWRSSKAALGDLDKVARVVRLGGFINSAAGFVDGPKVMNGASDLMVEVFGDKGPARADNCRRLRSAWGCRGRSRRHI